MEVIKITIINEGIQKLIDPFSQTQSRHQQYFLHDAELQITSEAISYLSSINRPIAITTIAGLYRTGKSFLVNRLLPNGHSHHQDNPFRVGMSTQSMTKGLNILATPISIQCQDTG